MATTVGDVTLDHDPIWIDEFDREIASGASYVALDGTENVYVGCVRGSYAVTLEATEETGWLSGSTVEALISLARVRDAVYTLTYNSVDYPVRFRHEVSGGAIQMRHLMPTANPGDDTWYSGKIYLMCTG
jgi:hypothetical protein